MKNIVFENLEIFQNVDFGKFTTMKLDGRTKYFTVVKSVEDFSAAVHFLKKENIPFFILGGGSNTIVRSKFFPGIVIKNEILGFEQVFEDDKKIEFKINSGVNWDEFVRFAVSKNLSGCEAMAMIPGTVGALPIQNVGAYGQEVVDILKGVEVFEIETEKIKTLSKEECQLSYRDSIFKRDKKDKYFVISINLELSKGRPEDPKYETLKHELKKKGIKEEDLTSKDVMEAVVKIRSRKLPDPEEIPSAGSFFKNVKITESIAEDFRKKYPEIPIFKVGDEYKIPTGWLIEQAGLKGREFFGMRVHPGSALVLTNISAKSYDELAQARKLIQDRVFEKFGLKIEQEPLEI